jgi:hypothetical protein
LTSDLIGLFYLLLLKQCFILAELLFLDTFNTFESSNSDGNILLDFCDLTELDPWDPTIVTFIWQQEDPSLECKPKLNKFHNLSMDNFIFHHNLQILHSFGDAYIQKMIIV